MADNSTKEHGNGKARKVVFTHATSEVPGKLSALQVEQLQAMAGDEELRTEALAQLLGVNAGMEPASFAQLANALKAPFIQQALRASMAIAQAMEIAETEPEQALDTLLASYALIRQAQEPLEETQAKLKKVIGDVALPLERNVRAHGYEAQYVPGYATTSYPKTKLEGLAAASDALGKALDKIKVERTVGARITVRKV